MTMRDPQTVITKCNRVMKANVGLFTKHLGEYTRHDDSFYFGEKENENVKIAFNSSGKLISKVFALYAVLFIPNVEMERDWEIRSRFSGGMKIQSMIFKPSRKEDIRIADKFNYNETLMKKLISIVTTFDIKDIIINYNKAQQRINVKIIPYAGTLIWVKIPPLYYDVNLKDFEAEKICELLWIFEKYFKEEW